MNDRDFAALRTLYLNGGAAIIDGKIARKFAAKDWVHIEVAEDDWAAQQSLVVPCTLKIAGVREYREYREYKKAVERRSWAKNIAPALERVTLDEVSSWEERAIAGEYVEPPHRELDLGDVPQTSTENKKPEEVEEEIVIEWEIEGLPAEVAEEGEG